MFLWLLWAPARDMAFSEEALYDTGQFHQEPEQKVEEISCFEETSDVIVVDIWLMWCDKKAALAAYSARVAFEAKSASAIFLGSESNVQERCAASKKMGTAAVRGLVTWSPGHVWWVDECHEGQHLHTESLWCIWHCLTVSKNGHEGHDTMERESSLRLLAEAILDYLRVVFQFQSGSNLRRLPRNIQVGLVGLCALADKCFHHENHGFKLLTYISWLRMLRYQFWYEFDMDLRLQFDDLDYMTGDNERPRDFRPRKPLWRPQLVQRRQGLTVRKMTRQHVMSCVR